MIRGTQRRSDSVCFEVHVEQDNGEITYQCGADWVGGWRLVALWSDDATEAAVAALGREAVEEAARDAFFSGGPRSEIERSGRGQAEGLDDAVRAALDAVASMPPMQRESR